MSEHDTQSAIIQLITVRGGIAIRVNSGMHVIKGNDGSTRVFKGASKGTSDIIACFKGKFLAIEVKHGKNQATPEQRDFIQRVNDCGGIGIVTWDLDKVIYLLDMIDTDAFKWHVV